MTSLTLSNLYLNSIRNDNTRKAMKDGLYRILLASGDEYHPPEAVDIANWEVINQQDIERIIDRLEEQYSASTINLSLSALRGVLEQAWRCSLITRDHLDKLVIQDVKITTEPPGRMIEPDEINKLLTACFDIKTDEGLRNAAAFGIAYQCGLRRQELSDLKKSDYYKADGRLSVLGKGSKRRNVYVSGKVKQILEEYLTLSKDSTGSLLQSLDSHGKLRSGTSVGIQGLHDMLQKMMKLSCVNHLTWHDFRRTFISTLLMKGFDPIAVCKMAGHASVEQTMRYDRRPEMSRKDMFNSLDIS